MHEIPKNWTRKGLVLPRNSSGFGSEVIGDPCIVWDSVIENWRMFLFADPPGHGHAISEHRDNVGPGAWTFLGPLQFTNPESLLGGKTHKPFVVLDPYQPNHAANIDGRYCLVSVSYKGKHKVVQQAWSDALGGPWTLEIDVLIDVGATDAFDAKHVDAVSGYYFAERNEILYFYMGYPEVAQPRAISPYGSAQGIAIQQPGENKVTKHGVILSPFQERGHWASGWVGGLQLLPANDHGWFAILNASPTPPNPNDPAISKEEPPPSLAGFAICGAEFPISGWKWMDQPIEWMDTIISTEHLNQEAVNFWRQHLLMLPNDEWALYYNSGNYGQEQLFMKQASSI